jgi:hypothetical protein
VCATARSRAPIWVAYIDLYVCGTSGGSPALNHRSASRKATARVASIQCNVCATRGRLPHRIAPLKRFPYLLKTNVALRSAQGLWQRPICAQLSHGRFSIPFCLLPPKRPTSPSGVATRCALSSAPRRLFNMPSALISSHHRKTAPRRRCRRKQPSGIIGLAGTSASVIWKA